MTRLIGRTAFLRSPYCVIRPLVRPHIPERLLEVHLSAVQWYLQQVLTFCGTGGNYTKRETTIDSLPDDLLLEIFDFNQKICRENRVAPYVWKWDRLVHVCRRWRQLIFASPRRLNLEILCTEKTPVKERLCIWPAFPIVLTSYDFRSKIGSEGEDNIIAALGHPDRICYVKLTIVRSDSDLEKMIMPMQESFPVLTHLRISTNKKAPVLPAGFLGRSAPRLRDFRLHRIPFPTLPTLLLSTSNLVSLSLSSIPRAGYISPEAMAVGLASLTRLKRLTISFQSLSFSPDQISPPPVIRILLPTLTSFSFRGARAYLENLVARIDSPQLDRIHINYSYQLFDDPVTQLVKFIGRSISSELTQLRHARVCFFDKLFTFTMHYHPSSNWRISCQGIGLQVSDIAQSFRQFSATLSNVVYLKLRHKEDCQIEGTDNIEWLLLLRQFSRVRSLYVSRDLARSIALLLEDINEEMVSEVLPYLDLIYLDGQPVSSLEMFVAVRQHSGRPVTVVDTKTEFSNRLESSLGE